MYVEAPLWEILELGVWGRGKYLLRTGLKKKKKNRTENKEKEGCGVVLTSFCRAGGSQKMVPTSPCPWRAPQQIPAHQINALKWRNEYHIVSGHLWKDRFCAGLGAGASACELCGRRSSVLHCPVIPWAWALWVVEAELCLSSKKISGNPNLVWPYLGRSSQWDLTWK